MKSHQLGPKLDALEIGHEADNIRAMVPGIT